METHKEHKRIVTETIFHKIDYRKPITFGEIDIELQPDDVILQNHEEEYHGSDSAMDAHWSITVYRDRLETDEEYETRLINAKMEMEHMKKRRYENYLKLKEEFENGTEG